MAFAPTSVVHLCNMPIDSTYRNQIFYTSKSHQDNNIFSRVKHSFGEYLFVRKTLPNGSIQSSIKVGANIDTLYDCNYMMYLNQNHGDKWFYAFITKMLYVNENTTEIVFETDVVQTWLFDVDIKDSFVVREHSETDNFNEHIVPEPFSCGDYTYTYIDDVTNLNDWGYLIALSNPADSSKEGEMPKEISGVFQGLYFYYIKDWQDAQVRTFLAGLDIDSVQFITLIPELCMEGVDIGVTDDNPNVNQYYVQGTDSPHSETYTINFDRYTSTFEGYTPKNRKMYTSPWMNLVVTNHAGKSAVYNVEEFTNTKSYTEGSTYLDFSINADISASPSIFLYPRYYKGLPHGYEFGISLSDFPQCSYTNDAFKLWLAKNHETIGVNVGMNLLNTAAGIGLAGAGLGMSNHAAGRGVFLQGTGMVADGIGGLLNTWASYKAAEHTANRATAGNPKNNLLTAMKQYTLAFYKRTARKDIAKSVDDYFTMFGYQTNKVKKPNLSSRPFFNYVQTNGVNIIPKANSAVPNEDMERLKRVFDEGVTFWKPTATVGDYSVDNSP